MQRAEKNTIGEIVIDKESNTNKNFKNSSKRKMTFDSLIGDKEKNEEISNRLKKRCTSFPTDIQTKLIANFSSYQNQAIENGKLD